MPNVLPTSVIYELLRASRLADLQPDPAWYKYVCATIRLVF